MAKQSRSKRGLEWYAARLTEADLPKLAELIRAKRTNPKLDALKKKRDKVAGQLAAVEKELSGLGWTPEAAAQPKRRGRKPGTPNKAATAPKAQPKRRGRKPGTTAKAAPAAVRKPRRRSVAKA